MHAYQIDLFMLNGDRHRDMEPIFLKIAKDLNIPTMIPYYVYSATEKDLHGSVPSLKRKWFVSDYIKKSQAKFNNITIHGSFYYPHPVATVLLEMGVLTSNPARIGAGKSDILCLCNKYLATDYIKAGVDRNKIHIVGDVVYDELFRNFKNRKIIRDEYSERYLLNKNKKIIIIALPQLWEDHVLAEDNCWDEINYLISTLCALGENVLVSLHPKMNMKMYSFLEVEYPCRIVKESLFSVLPIADMFVSCYSSTILWSILCGINTIAVNFYNINVSFFDYLTSIRRVREKDAFFRELSLTLSANIDFSTDWENLSRCEVFDGNVIQRYINLIHEVSGK
jgi:hypothetical protein